MIYSRTNTMGIRLIISLLFVTCLRHCTAQDWNYILFSQSWPATVCWLWTASDPSHTCSFPKDHDAWSIHGIWPTMEGSMGPEFCNQTWLFDPEEVKPLASELEQSWMNILKDTPVHSLWAHEWNKHGTCGAAVESLNSQIKYFSTGIYWLQKYTMTTILSEADIVPSDTKTYTPNEIHHAIKKTLGVVPEIICKYFEGKQYLLELRICFSRSLEIIDCKYKEYVRDMYNDDADIISNCNLTGILYE